MDQNRNGQYTMNRPYTDGGYHTAGSGPMYTSAPYNGNVVMYGPKAPGGYSYMPHAGPYKGMPMRKPGEQKKQQARKQAQDAKYLAGKPPKMNPKKTKDQGKSAGGPGGKPETVVSKPPVAAVTLSAFNEKRGKLCTTAFNSIQAKVVKAVCQPTKFTEMSATDKLKIVAFGRNQTLRNQEAVYESQKHANGEVRTEFTPVVVGHRGDKGPLKCRLAKQYADALGKIEKELQDTKGMYMKKEPVMHTYSTAENGEPNSKPVQEKMKTVKMDPDMFIAALDQAIKDGQLSPTQIGCRLTKPVNTLHLAIPATLKQELTTFSADGEFSKLNKSKELLKAEEAAFWKYILPLETASTIPGKDKDWSGINGVEIPLDADLAKMESAYYAAVKAHGIADRLGAHALFVKEETSNNKETDISVAQAFTDYEAAQENYKHAMKAHHLLVDPEAKVDEGNNAMPKFTVLNDVQQALYEALREEPYAAQPAPERVVREFYRMARSWHHARQTALNNHEIKNLVEIRHASAPLLNAWFIHQLAAYQYMEECFYTCNQDPVMKDDTSFVEMNIALWICHKEWCKLPDSIFRVSAKAPQFFAPAVFLTHLAILKENTSSRKQTNGLDFVQNADLLNQIMNASKHSFKKCVDSSLVNMLLVLLSENVLPFETALHEEHSLDYFVRAHTYAQATNLIYDNQQHNYGETNSDVKLMEKLDFLNLTPSIQLHTPQNTCTSVDDFTRMTDLRNKISPASIQFVLSKLTGLVPRATGNGRPLMPGSFESIRHRIILPYSKESNSAAVLLSNAKPNSDYTKEHKKLVSELSSLTKQVSEQKKTLLEERRAHKQSHVTGPRSGHAGSRGRTPTRGQSSERAESAHSHGKKGRASSTHSRGKKSTSRPTEWTEPMKKLALEIPTKRGAGISPPVPAPPTATAPVTASKSDFSYLF